MVPIEKEFGCTVLVITSVQPSMFNSRDKIRLHPWYMLVLEESAMGVLFKDFSSPFGS